MPILVEEESIRPQETYSNGRLPWKWLRSRSPSVFEFLRAAYLNYSRLEAAITLPTPLDPAYHLVHLKRALGVIQGRIVLDVGGGLAPYRKLLDDGRDAWFVLEKDRFHALELVHKGGNADYIVGAAENIPLTDGCCDLIVLTEVLEHCNQPQSVLKEVARILRPGGYCIGTAPQYWHVHGWPSDYFRYTLYGLQFLAEQASLAVRCLEPKGGPILLLWAVVDLTIARWTRLPGISLLLRTPSLYIAWLLDRVFFPSPKRMSYPDTVGWAFLFEKVAA